jgi:predicted small secreted protein
MKRLVTLSLVSLALVLAGCNTIRGIGQDIEKAGSAIEKSAK